MSKPFLYRIGIRPIFGNKGHGLTWPGPLHKRIGRRIGNVFVRLGRGLGAY